MRRAVFPVLALAMLMSCASVAQAHIQVTPTTAAPGDAVQFVLLVPNERDQATVDVSLQIPKDVLPFSFSEDRLATDTGQEQRRQHQGRALAWPTAARNVRTVRVPRLHAGAHRHDLVEGDPDLCRRRGSRLDRAPRRRRAGGDHAGDRRRTAAERRRRERGRGRRGCLGRYCSSRDRERRQWRR